VKEPNLRIWHRKVGIVVAPLLLLQAVSGIFLSVDWLLGIHERVGELITRNVPPLLVLWDRMLVQVHYGLDVGGAFYHVMLGLGAVWMVVSGVMIYMRLRARLKKT